MSEECAIGQRVVWFTAPQGSATPSTVAGYGAAGDVPSGAAIPAASGSGFRPRVEHRAVMPGSDALGIR